MQKYILELKNRVLLMLLSYISVVFTSYNYKDILLFIVIKPRNIFNSRFNFFYFIFTDVTEIFYVYFKLVFFLSFQVIVLMTLYHFFLFITPALYRHEFKYLKLIFMVISFVGLISFIVSYFFIIPVSWDFFLSFKDLLANKSFTIHFEAKLIEYFNFYISIYYTCGAYFQLFGLLFFILNYITKNTQKFRKIFYFVFIIFSALICPEIFSQILISFLLIIMYEMFLFIYIFNNKIIYAGNQLKLIKTPVVKIKYPNDKGKKHFQPKYIS
jgi:sec-independent protein translocase protein TatC